VGKPEYMCVGEGGWRVGSSWNIGLGLLLTTNMPLFLSFLLSAPVSFLKPIVILAQSYPLLVVK
jgi:hypothetical protein